MDEIEKIAVSGLLRYPRSNRCIVYSCYSAVLPGKGHRLQLPLVQADGPQRTLGKPQVFSHAHNEPEGIALKFRFREPGLCECIHNSPDAGTIPFDKPGEVKYL